MPKIGVNMDPPAIVQVAETISYEQAVSQLQVIARNNWKIGEIADKVPPKYGEQTLQSLADESGVAYETLVNCRRVYRAWKEDIANVGNISWCVCKEFISQPDRLDLIRNGNPQTGEPWTVRQARELVRSRSEPISIVPESEDEEETDDQQGAAEYTEEMVATPQPSECTSTVEETEVEGTKTPLPTVETTTEPEQRPSSKHGSKGGYVTLEGWKNLGAKEKKALLATEGGAGFNPQTTDSIEWAQWSWNPVTGCRHDCPYCYARDIARRFYEPEFEPALWYNRLRAPVTRQPSSGPFTDDVDRLGQHNVFVCSMADLFGRWVPREWIEAVLKTCSDSPQWNFLFLTKFPNRMTEFEYPDNCWLGTTVDQQARVRNAEKSFRKVKAKVKWLSCEPLLEPLRFEDIGAFDWVVLGGASTSSITPEWHPPRDWIVAIHEAAREAGVPVYEKTNLLSRVRQYPGIQTVETDRAPEQLIYLPTEIG